MSEATNPTHYLHVPNSNVYKDTEAFTLQAGTKIFYRESSMFFSSFVELAIIQDDGLIRASSNNGVQVREGDLYQNLNIFCAKCGIGGYDLYTDFYPSVFLQAPGDNEKKPVSSIVAKYRAERLDIEKAEQKRVQQIALQERNALLSHFSMSAQKQMNRNKLSPKLALQCAQQGLRQRKNAQQITVRSFGANVSQEILATDRLAARIMVAVDDNDKIIWAGYDATETRSGPRRLLESLCPTRKQHAPSV